MKTPTSKDLKNAVEKTATKETAYEVVGAVAGLLLGVAATQRLVGDAKLPIGTDIGNMIPTKEFNIPFVGGIKLGGYNIAKMTEIKRIASFFMGASALVLAKMLGGAGKPALRMGLWGFGLAAVAATVLGIGNPVTMRYNAFDTHLTGMQGLYEDETSQPQSYGTTAWKGDVVGQGTGMTGQPLSYSAPAPFLSPAVPKPATKVKAGLLQPAPSTNDPAQPAIQMFASTTDNTGRTTGQTDPGYNTAPGTYYGTEIYNPGQPKWFYGGDGCINIRSSGETDLTGGI